VAYDSNRMSRTRRNALLTLLLSSALSAQEQFPPDQRHPDPFPKRPDEEDRKLPNGKSQKDAIAKENYEQSLKDANNMIQAATSLRDELQKAGNYVVPITAVKKTEEIEKLARRIRSRLKA